MANGSYATKLIEFFDDEFMRYVYETRDTIIEKVEKRKSAGKKKANGKVSIGFYGHDLSFSIDKNTALALAYKAAGIDDLGTLAKATSKRYSLFHFDFNDVNEITFKFFGFFGKTKTCKLFIQELQKVLTPCGIEFVSLSQDKLVTDAKIKYRCDISQYKAPIKSANLQTQVKKGLEELLNTYELMCTFNEDSIDPIICYSYLRSKELNRNVLLKFTVNTTPVKNSQQYVAIFGMSLGVITDKDKANAFREERNARVDRNKEFSIVQSEEFFIAKPIVFSDVNELMEKFENVLAEGARLLKEKEFLSYAETAEKTWGEA